MKGSMLINEMLQLMLEMMGLLREKKGQEMGLLDYRILEIPAS